MAVKKKSSHPLFIQPLLHIEKRIRLVVSVLLCSAVMTISTFFFFDKAFIFLPTIAIVVYIATYLAILDGIDRTELFTLFLMPVLLSVSAYLFYFLFPARWLTRLPFLITYAISLYALMLSSNIFNVGVVKSLQLYRAAFSVNFFFQAVLLFLSTSVLYSFHLHVVFNTIGTGILVYLLLLQLLWTISLKPLFEQHVLRLSLLGGVVFAQLSGILSFVPFQILITALIISALYYAFSGLVYHLYDNKLFKETIREYIFVASLVVVIALLTLRW